MNTWSSRALTVSGSDVARFSSFHVVPVVAVFTADIYAADKSGLPVDDRGFRVVTRDNPGVGQVAKLDLRLTFHVHAHGERVLVIFGATYRLHREIRP